MPSSRWPLVMWIAALSERAMPDIRHKRGTRAALNTLASGSGLKPGQIYVLTDESRIAVALTSNAYQAFSKEGEGGGSGSTVTVSDTAPSSPSDGDQWFDTNSGVQYTRVGAAWVEPWFSAGSAFGKRSYLWA